MLSSSSETIIGTNIVRAVVKMIFGKPVDFNPSILCIAEQVRHMPGIKRVKDYLLQGKKLLESSPMEISFAEDTYTEKLGGKRRLQGYNCTISDRLGYALMFAISFKR